MKLGLFILLAVAAFAADEKTPAKAAAKKPAQQPVAQQPAAPQAAVPQAAAAKLPQKAVAKKVDVNCVDVPRVIARKRPPQPVQKLDLSAAMRSGLNGVLLGVSLDKSLDLNLDMEAPNEDSAGELEKLVGVLMAAQRLQTKPGDTISIDLPAASRVVKSGNRVRTTVSLTDAQLEKLLVARYGRRMVSQAKLAMAIYVHGLETGMRTIPFEN